MKSFYNLPSPQQPTERLRRVVLMMKAIRDMNERDAYGLLAMAFLANGDQTWAARALSGGT